MAPYRLLVTRLQVSEFRALWVHRVGVPPTVPEALAWARRGGPKLWPSFYVRVTAAGPAPVSVLLVPEVKESLAQLALPALSPPRGKRGSEQRRPGEA